MEIIKPSMDTKQIMDSYLRFNHYRGCEFSSANCVFWGDYYQTSFTIIEDMLAFCKEEEGMVTSFTFPVGAHDPKYAFDKMVDYFKANNLPFAMHMIEPEMFAQIEQWYPGIYKIEYDINDSLFCAEGAWIGKKTNPKYQHKLRIYSNMNGEAYIKITSIVFWSFIRIISMRELMAKTGRNVWS